MKKTDFFIVGAAKSGTTSLARYLNDHPEIQMSEIKEPNYFSFEEVDAQQLHSDGRIIRTEKEYHELFSGQTEKVWGEASVSYLFYPNAASRIQLYNPKAKIIILLRAPSKRAYSHYIMDQRLGLVDMNFEDIVYKKGSNPKLNLYYQQYIELGFYFAQVSRYLQIFGKENVSVNLMSDFISEPSEFTKMIYSFVGVDSNFSPEKYDRHNAHMASKNRIIQRMYKSKIIRKSIKKLSSPKLLKLIQKVAFKNGKPNDLGQELEKQLKSIYREDVIKLEALLNRNLNEWYD